MLMFKLTENYAGGGTLNITNAIDMWGGEQDEYQPGKDTGLHFSQVVWKSTKELGCASVTCPGSLVGLPEGVRALPPTFIH